MSGPPPFEFSAWLATARAGVPWFADYEAKFEALAGRALCLDDYRRAHLVLENARSQIREHPFWDHLPQSLSDQDARHQTATSSPLLATDPSQLSLATKPFPSIYEKSYRLNALDPDITRGPCVPDAWFTQIDDLVRTRIVCKYLDGPDEVVTCILRHAATHGISAPVVRTHAADRGYYAHHVYLPHTIEIPDGHGIVALTIHLEIQVTTQLQEVLDQLTHRLYESDRSTPRAPSDAWKWQFREARFFTAYISHALHLLEAQIVATRDHLAGPGVATTHIPLEPDETV